MSWKFQNNGYIWIQIYSLSKKREKENCVNSRKKVFPYSSLMFKFKFTPMAVGEMEVEHNHLIAYTQNVNKIIISYLFRSYATLRSSLFACECMSYLQYHDSHILHLSHVILNASPALTSTLYHHPILFSFVYTYHQKTTTMTTKTTLLHLFHSHARTQDTQNLLCILKAYTDWVSEGFFFSFWSR